MHVCFVAYTLWNTQYTEHALKGVFLASWFECVC